MKVSVIATVKNEKNSVRLLLNSLKLQSRQPDEVIIVDGGSRDGTVETLLACTEEKALPVRVLVSEGCNISEGRNLAIEAATGDVIAATDAGVHFGPEWLAELVSPFQAENPPGVVSGFFVADPHSTFEVAMGATVLPHVEEVRPDRFLPSSRSVAFRRCVWEAVGGYPTWMTFSEDLLFDMALKNRGFRFVFRPTALVQFRPRSTLWAFWHQYRNYAMGDGEGLLWTNRHLVRYGTYLIVLPLLIALGAWSSPLFWALIVLGFAAYLRRPYARLVKMWTGLSGRDKVSAALLVPVIRVWGDVAKMVGYPMGLPRGFRQRHRTRAYLYGSHPAEA